MGKYPKFHNYTDEEILAMIKVVQNNPGISEKIKLILEAAMRMQLSNKKLKP